MLAPLLASAWSCTAGDTLLTVLPNFTYSVRLAASPWLEHGDISIHTGGAPGTWLSVSDGGLTPLAAASRSGLDSLLGSWQSLNISWAGAPAPLHTAFICWGDADLLEWRAELPAGAPAPLSPERILPDSSFYSFNLSRAASLHFPSFRLGPAAAASALGHVQWAGEFAFHDSNFGVSFAGFVGGQLGGPVVLHEPSWARGGGAPGKPRAAVLGPLAGFKDSHLFIVPDVTRPASDAWRLVFGPHSHFDALPRGFSSRLGLAAPRALAAAPPPATAVFPGDTGITAAVYAYGAVLRRLARTTRFAPEADKGTALLSAWTSNGNAYDGDWWATAGHKGTGGGTFEALRRGFDALGLPVATLQLDPYWFSMGSPGNKDWLPSEDVFGRGGGGFSQTTAAFNTTLYSFMWAAQPDFSPQLNLSFAISPKWDNFMGGPFGRIAPGDSEAFYGVLMARCVAWGCAGFEVDFLDMQYAGFPDVLGTPMAFEAFLRGLSSAGARFGVPVQLCMPLPSDVLASSWLSGVSNIRASDDNDLDYASPDRWRIGLTSLLHGALDIRPFMDGVWSAPTNPGYGYTQHATELGVAISALSTGPVGLGDAAGAANATLVRAAAAANGVILKPSLPAAPVDAFFLYDAGGASALQAARAELWAAPSFVPPPVRGAAAPGRGGLARYLNHTRGAPVAGTFPATTACPFFSVLSVDAPAFTLLPSDLTPSLALCRDASAYVALPWSPGFAAMAARCAEGAAAAGCVVAFGGGGLDVATGAAPSPAVKGGPHAWELFSLAPLYASSGWALLGELAKFVRVSPVRFSAIDASVGGSLTAWVEGAPGEVVSVALLAPGEGGGGGGGLGAARVRLVSVVFGPGGGTATVVCSGAGAAAACAHTVASA